MKDMLHGSRISGGLVLALALAAPAFADDVSEGTIDITAPKPKAKPKPKPGVQLEQAPEYGVYYDRKEPSFYTGFAPRSQEPERVHLQIGRGNQVRFTLVLSDEAIDGYARDLLYRYQTYKQLIDTKKIKLSQNTS